ncbi:MAG: thiamine-phosphate kinase [Caulobacter sp.]|nr:thiamine-phosphate kinase [Caulobacter sp.]
MPSAPEDPPGDEGEFGWIERLLRPLTRGAPEALNLLDDAALISPRPGFDLVVTKDTMVAGVHFLPDDPLDTVARKLLAVNLSDLAAKGAGPLGYFLSAAWPRTATWADKALFAEGLRQAGDAWSLPLLGGDTVSTPGPLTLSATLMGEVPAGRMVRRSTARPGDILMVSGTIGDGWLGLQAARGQVSDPDGYLAGRYRTPTPRLDLIDAVSTLASASADVSDGLLADAGRIAIASGCGVVIDLDAVPLSPAAASWLAGQPDEMAGRRTLASGGDDYEILCAATAEAVPALAAAGLTAVGRVVAGQGVEARFDGQSVDAGSLGWTH